MRLVYLIPLLLLCQSLTVQAGPPRCFLHGIISPLADNSEKGSLSNMIRLHFDAATQGKCEELMNAYCRYNVLEKRYSPERLKGSFKPDVDKAEEISYTFSAKCKLQNDND